MAHRTFFARVREAHERLQALMIEAYQQDQTQGTFAERVRTLAKLRYSGVDLELILALFEKAIESLPAILEFIAGIVDLFKSDE